MEQLMTFISDYKAIIILIIILIFIFLPLILPVLTALIELFGWIIKRIISLISWIIDIFKEDKKRRG